MTYSKRIRPIFDKWSRGEPLGDEDLRTLFDEIKRLREFSIGYTGYENGLIEIVIKNNDLPDEIVLERMGTKDEVDRIAEVLPMCVFVPARREER